ncbi:MAG TPA: cytochrome c3 family protein [Anaerolineae bacterium]
MTVNARLRRPGEGTPVAGRALALAALLVLLLAGGVHAAPQFDSTAPAAPAPANASTSAAAPAAAVPTIDNSVCLGCHKNAGLTLTFANGEVLSLTMDPSIYSASVHGAKNIACVSCHTNISGYPHPKVTAGDHRSFQLERYTQCQTCHADQYKATLDSNHGRALAAGNRQAALCTDCHGAHDVKDPRPASASVLTAQMCQKCHSTVYSQYQTSVHGTAVSRDGNADAPVCIDCHGVHKQDDPTTSAFRLKSPDICAKCHGDATLMRKYGISTDVMNSYVADFHGTTVKLFEKESPNQATNKAVCTDCHGVHDIKKVTDANATVVKENLLTTCRKCHPDAQANFPTSWVGHYQPSPTRNALVYYVNLFYKILIPAVIGGMLLFVLLDAVRRILDRFQKGA